MFLRQNTIQAVNMGPFLDITDGVTEEVALAITQALRQVSKDGAGYAQTGTTGNATHNKDGHYTFNLSAADTNTVGLLKVMIQIPATALPVWEKWWVIEESVYDSIYGAGATLNFNALTIEANAITAAAIATDAIGSDEFSQAAADKVWSSATRTLTAFSTALALNVWHVLESAIVTASTIGLKLKNNVDAAVTSRATPAQVNTEVLDVLTVDVTGEPAQGAPPLSTNIRDKIDWLYKCFRNRKTETTTQWNLFNDAETVIDSKATVSDASGTATKQKIISGP